MLHSRVALANLELMYRSVVVPMFWVWWLLHPPPPLLFFYSLKYKSASRGDDGNVLEGVRVMWLHRDLLFGEECHNVCAGDSLWVQMYSTCVVQT